MNKPGKLLALALASTIIASCGTGTKKTPQEYISQAQDHIDKNELITARIELKNALQIAPSNPQARWLLGNLYIKLGDGQSAEKELNQAVSLGVSATAAQPLLAQAYMLQEKYQAVLDQVPDPRLSQHALAEVLAERGLALLAQKKTGKAQAEFDKALAADPKSVQALFGKAKLSAVGNDIPQARKDLDQVFSIDKHYAPAWSLLGTIEVIEGHSDKAEKAFTNAIDNRYANSTDLLNRIYLRIAANKTEEAKADIEQIKSKFNKSPLIDYAEGLLDFQQKHYAKAITAFEKILSVDTNNIPALYYTGASHFMVGNTNQAEDYLSRFNFQRPNYVPALKMLAWLKLKNGKFKDAESLIRTALKQDKDDAFSMNLLANALIGQKKTTEGVDYFQKIVSLKPGFAPARVNLGIGLIAEGDIQSGVDELKKAKELSPESEDPDIKIILTYLHNKSLDKALEAALEYLKQHPKSVTAHTMLGTVYMAKGDLDKAGKLFEEELKLDPGNVTANSGLAGIALRSGNMKKAIQHYKDSLKKHPKDLATLMNLAKVEYAQKSLDAMKSTLQQAVSSNSQALAPRLMLGQYYLQSGNPDKAVNLLVDLRSTQEKNPTYLALLGEAEVTSGSYHDARNDLTKLIKLAPNDANAHWLLANAYKGLKEQKSFKTELQKTLALNKDYRQARISLAQLLISENSLKEARTQLDMLEKGSKDDPNIMTLEGDLARVSGDLKKAIDFYRQAFEQQQNNFNLLRLEAAQWKNGDHESAIKLLESWIAKYPNDPLIEMELGSRYLSLGRKADAVAAYSKLVEKSPDNVVALNNLAVLTMDSAPEQAVRYAEKAYTIAPDSAMVMDTLAVVLSKNDTKRAEKMIAKALESNPDNPAFLYHKAVILRDAGKHDEAMQAVKSLLKRYSDFPEKEDAKRLLEELSAHT